MVGGISLIWAIPISTTGCNLNRDIGGAIRSAGFKELEVEDFELSLGLPMTLPNIVGRAVA